MGVTMEFFATDLFIVIVIAVALIGFGVFSATIGIPEPACPDPSAKDTGHAV
jgi:hypothetical protein